MFDKNQFYFNIIFTVLFMGLIITCLLLCINLVQVKKGIISMNTTLDKISMNHIQAAHYQLDYMLTTEGFFIRSVNDFGNFDGPSMQPAIFDDNTLLQIKYNENVTLDAGQIIRYINEDGIAVIHRIRAVYQNSVFVQGDNLKEGEIVGKDRITHVIVGVLFT